MVDWTKYTSIEGIEKVIGHFIGEKVHVVEKIDGSNFSIHIEKSNKNGYNITTHSRNQGLHAKQQAGQFVMALEMAEQIIPDLLRYGPATYYFEFFGAGIQKRIPYSNNKHLALLDIKVDGKYMNHDKVVQRGAKLGVYVAPSYGIFKLTRELLADMMQGNGDFEFSQVIRDFAMIQENEAGDIEDRICPEGFVLKPIKEWRTHYDLRALAKVKQDWFLAKENKACRPKKDRVEIPGEVIEFAMNSVDFDRLASVYSHGEFEPKYDMTDMRHLITLVVADIKSEADEIWGQHPEKAITNAINKRLPVILKGYLMEVNSK